MGDSRLGLMDLVVDVDVDVRQRRHAPVLPPAQAFGQDRGVAHIDIPDRGEQAQVALFGHHMQSENRRDVGGVVAFGQVTRQQLATPRGCFGVTAPQGG